ncbi:MAG: hypothetical protein R2705_18135 [Ilumatobacteraceae bacterium]
MTDGRDGERPRRPRTGVGAIPRRTGRRDGAGLEPGRQHGRARRTNVLFDADLPDGPRRLVATILPTMDIQINPITAEAAVRGLAERYGCRCRTYVG